MTASLYTVFLVPSSNHALQAEKILKQAGVECKLIPVPRQIHSNCGVCIRVLRSVKLQALDILSPVGLKIEDYDIES